MEERIMTGETLGEFALELKKRSAVRGPLRNTCGMYVNLPHGQAGER